MKNLPLHTQIFIALLLAVPFGILFGAPGEGLIAEPIADGTAVFKFIGSLFLQSLKMLIVPLIVSAVITGVSNMGSGAGFARLGLKTIGFYALTSFLAIVTGLVLVNLLSPGIVDGVPARELIGLAELPEAQMAAIQSRDSGDIVGIFLRMVPPNIIKAASEGQMLGLITFSLVFGFYMMRIEKSRSDHMLNMWQSLYDIMMKITDLVMRFAPIGVFGLVANTIATTGFDALRPLSVFFVCVVLALAFHMFVTMSLLLWFVGKVNPLQHLKGMTTALLTAFSTSSSSATLPKTIECVEQNAGISRRVVSFTLPLGATVNMDGTALYECVAAMFIAQAYGMEISLTIQFTVVLTALLTSIGVAGIPSASLVAIVLILSTIGLPSEAIGLILVVDRVLDMCRTAVNVYSDSCGAVLIAQSEGETPYPQGQGAVAPSG
jgi:Na+/H+-dicarboxylate symporter